MTVPIEFIILLDVVLVSRLVFAIQDRPINRKQLFSVAFILLAGLSTFRADRELFGTAILFLLVLTVQFLLENNGFPVNKVRIVSLAFYFLGLFIVQKANLMFNPSTLTPLKNTSNYYIAGLVIDSALFEKILLLILGLLLISFESNHFIRMMLDSSNLTLPTSSNSKAGRIIGVLERILIFTFVMQNELSAIAFILAAKSFARFEKMKEQRFAEYVLIGTLLSSVLALAIALLVSKLKIATI